MAEEERNPCDVDDVVCKMEVLVDLNGLPKGLGNAQFLDKFPELARLEETIAPKIGEQEKILRQSLENCGNSLPAKAETPAPEKLDDVEE